MAGASETKDREIDASGGRVLLVGNPNVGKSVLFGLLTGRYAAVSNYPGTTVEMARGKLRGRGDRPEVVDTPGVNSLLPVSIDELVTRDILLRERDGTVVQVIDARNLTRGLRITAELAELGLAVVVALNMVDEAAIDGLAVDHEKLERALGVDVVPTVAVERRGLGELFQGLRRVRPATFSVEYAPEIEAAVAEVEALLPEDLPVARRGVALMLLACDDEEIGEWLSERVAPEAEARILEIRQQLARHFPDALSYVIGQARWRAASELAAQVTARRRVSASRAREIASALSMHRVWGLVILAGVLCALYFLVGVVGAGIVSDWLTLTVIGTPPERVMALGDAATPGLVRAQPRVPSTLAGREVTLRPGRPGEHLVIRMRPGTGCPATLTAGGQYELSGTIVDGSLPTRVAVVLTSPGTSREVPVALQPEGAGRYAMTATFSPATDARYVLVVETRPPGEVTLGDVVLHSHGEGLFSPWLHRVVTTHVPWAFAQYLLVGQYGLLTLGLTLAFGVVLPILVFFFLFLAILEDSGYLARLTVLANRSLSAIGLSGRAVVPLVLGLGCDTMATLAARVLETPKARLITTFLLALGTPCSAQLGIILAMGSAIGPTAVLAILCVVAVQLFAAGYVANRVLPGQSADFLCEIPPLRWPTPGNVARKTWQRAEWFLREAVPYFFGGTAALAVLAWVGALGAMERLLQPIVVGMLSLPKQATYAFIIGFLRRDFGAAGLFQLQRSGQMDHLQIVVALITMTLSVPCIANFLVMAKEQGTRKAVALFGVIGVVAVLTGTAVNLVLRALGVTF